jgi:hypothetical protein
MQLEKPSSSHAEMRGASRPYNRRHREVGFKASGWRMGR